GVVQRDRLVDHGAALALYIELGRGVHQFGGVGLCHRRAWHLTRGLNGPVDVQETSALLVGRSSHVGRRAGQDLLHHGRRRRSAVVAVTVGLDDVSGGAGDERGRLAGAAEGLGRKRKWSLTRAGGGEGQ